LEEKLPSAIDMIFHLKDDGSVTVRYSQEKIQEPMVSRVCDALQRVATHLCDDDALVSELIIDQKKECARAPVSSAIGAICEERLSGHLVHEQFEQMAAEKPNKTCLVFGNDSLSYQEVQKKADILASHLLQQGLERGSLVGVLLERSFDLIVGLLGVLKAGCGYVPVRRIWFVSRRDYMHIYEIVLGFDSVPYGLNTSLY
jgi:non-ribosomal peptide synthetase component F